MPRSIFSVSRSFSGATCTPPTNGWPSAVNITAAELQNGHLCLAVATRRPAEQTLLYLEQQTVDGSWALFGFGVADTPAIGLSVGDTLPCISWSGGYVVLDTDVDGGEDDGSMRQLRPNVLYRLTLALEPPVPTADRGRLKAVAAEVTMQQLLQVVA